jgi:hypothetical protein
MRARLTVSLGLAAALAGSFDVAYAKPPPSGPHLIVTSVKAVPEEDKPYHRFINGPFFVVLVKIKNTGTARMSRGGDHTGVLLSRPHGGLRFVHEDDVDLPRIGAGKTATVEAGASVRGFSRPDRITAADLKACVPVRGNAHFNGSGLLNDRQNCGKGPQVALIPRHWQGTMSVTHPVFGFAKMETDATARFTYSDPVSQHNGEFVYAAVGSLIHSVSGSNAFCSISGGQNGKIGPGDGFLVLDPDLLTYRGGMMTSEFYLAKQICNGVSVPVGIRTDGIRIPSKNVDLGIDTKLQGEEPGVGGLTFKWEIDAET